MPPDILRAGDLITNIDGHDTRALKDFSGIEAIASRAAGDRIPIAYVRQGTVQQADVTLVPKGMAASGSVRVSSDRRSGFPSVFIHDTAIMPHECGGESLTGLAAPLGSTSRGADRHETLTIPAELVMQEFNQLIRPAKAHSNNRDN